jgi:(R,R)-butanediol dehydrogenase/meso-butanediol dehydrogenase/diacetyl reductase
VVAAAGSQITRFKVGDRGAVFDAGPIGILMLQMARLQGAGQITVLEINPGRADIASEMGTNRVVSSFEEVQPDTYDMVIEATGAMPVMNRSSLSGPQDMAAGEVSNVCPSEKSVQPVPCHASFS